MKVYVDLRLESTIEMEVPDGMNEAEVHDYVSNNLEDAIELTIDGGSFTFDVWGKWIGLDGRRDGYVRRY